ncbi:MAG: hypothetical protein JST49_00665 [Bacteroidetes bacterium]|nr:hypothetical protein [Bacteroidota bacterium]
MGFVGIFAPVFLLYYIGTDIKDTVSKAIYFIALVCISIGIMFRIMHWPIATELLMGGIAACFLIAGKIFIGKKPKKAQDYLSIIWLALATIHYFTINEHGAWKYWLKPILSILLIVNIVYIIALYLRDDNA